MLAGRGAMMVFLNLGTSEEDHVAEKRSKTTSASLLQPVSQSNKMQRTKRLQRPNTLHVV